MGEAVLYAAVWGCALVPILAASLTAMSLRRIVVIAGALALVGAVVVVVNAATGEETDFYDIGREGALLLGLGFVALTLVFGLLAALLGRVLRVFVCRLRGRSASLW